MYRLIAAAMLGALLPTEGPVGAEACTSVPPFVPAVRAD